MLFQMVPVLNGTDFNVTVLKVPVLNSTDSNGINSESAGFEEMQKTTGVK